jgi:monoamine oxidase
VSTRDGKTYKSEFLICSVPIPMIKKIQFMPQLSRERRFINDRYIMGAFSKVIIIYDKSYWRDNGFSG